MTSAPRIRSFAFYHSAFQPTAETDAAVGRGWTDWSQVASAQPLYVGHQQPRLPRDLGFYDLRLEESRQQQVNLAEQFGINGFIYSHYWFAGRRMYDQAISANFEFALCWNNEDFTTPEGEIIIAQTYSEADDHDHAAVIVEALANPNCIRVENKPLFIVQDAEALPNAAQSAEIWREEARAAGVGEIYLAYCEGAGSTITPAQIGFDAAIEYAPLREASPATFYETLETHNYLDMASVMLARPEPAYRRFPSVTPGYDNTPTMGMNGCVFLDSQPDLYKGWVASTVQSELESGQDDVILFVNSWNDWACGSILEPCSIWGSRYLDAHYAGLKQATASLGVTNPVTPAVTPMLNEPLAPSAMVGVSVVMVVDDNMGATMRTLQSALDTCTDVGHLEFIVIDNGSQDETSATLSELKREIFSLRNDVALPARAAWEQGLQCANGQYVVFVSNDIVMWPNWFEPALLTLATDPACTAVTPLISAGGAAIISQPLTMTTGVCLLGRRAAMNGALPLEARTVEASSVALAVRQPAHT